MTFAVSPFWVWFYIVLSCLKFLSRVTLADRATLLFPSPSQIALTSSNMSDFAYKHAVIWDQPKLRPRRMSPKKTVHITWSTPILEIGEHTLLSVSCPSHDFPKPVEYGCWYKKGISFSRGVHATAIELTLCNVLLSSQCPSFLQLQHGCSFVFFC